MTHTESHGARAAAVVLSASEAAGECVAYLEELLRSELQAQGPPDVANLSIALGALEMPLTNKKEAEQQWPAGREALQAQVAACLEAFDGFVRQMHERLLAAGPANARAKVKLVADAVWSKLSGSFSKDILHAQHLYNFASILLAAGAGAGDKKGGGKRQLDCAGVVTTTYAVCQRLAGTHGHGDLAGCRMQISEDHCWLCLDPASPGRLASVEVTTDTAAKRALPPTEEAWAGWLYTGGHAVLCCPRTALAALVNSLNPAVSGGKGGQDSEQLQAAQHRLLALLWREARAAVYPAALCSLADLEEVALQDRLDAALEAGDERQLHSLLQRCSGDAQDLFEQGIALAAGRDWGAAEDNGQGNGEGEPRSKTVNNTDCASGGCSPANGREQIAVGGGTVAVVAGNPAAPAAPPAELAENGEAEDGLGNGAVGSNGGLVHEASHTAAALDAVAAANAAAGGGSWQQGPQPSAGGAGAGDAPCVSAPAAPGAPSHSLLPSSSAGNSAANGVPCPAAPADPGWQFYPYSYLGGFLARRAEFLLKCAVAFPASTDQYASLALESLRGALVAWSKGAGVLAKYKYSPADEQLYKDVEGALEYCHDGLAALAKRAAAQAGGGNGGAGALSDATLLQPVLCLWDGISSLFAGKPKPGGWVGLLLKIAKLFDPGAREVAAAAHEPRSEPLRKARGMWGALKPATLRPLLEAADVGQGEARAVKRPRR